MEGENLTGLCYLCLVTQPCLLLCRGRQRYREEEQLNWVTPDGLTPDGLVRAAGHRVGTLDEAGGFPRPQPASYTGSEVRVNSRLLSQC